MPGGPALSNAAAIRAWLKTQDGPRTVVEIADGIGRPGDVIVYQNCHRMFRDGILARSGRCRSYAFTVLRDPIVRKAMPRSEQLARNAEAERKRQWRKGRRTKAQYLADCKAMREARLAKLDAEKAKRRAEREAERKLREDERNAAKARKVRQAKPKAPPMPRIPNVRPMVAPPPAPKPAESVEDFLRRGGKIVRLAPHVVSHPLRTTAELRAA